MKRGFISKLLLPTTFIVLALISLTGISQTYNRDFMDGQVYFKFNDQVQVDIPVNADRTVDPENAPFLNAIRQQFDITGLSRPFDLNNDSKLVRTFELNFSQYDKIEAIMEELAKNPDLEYVEKVPLAYIDYTPDDSLYNLSQGSANWNWHLDVINAEMAWDLNTGSPDIKVAIVDNAVWIDHPDLVNKIVLSEDMTQPGIQNSNPPTGGDPSLWSHGTHTAGLAAAETNNGIGVASVGYNVSLIGVKASSSNPEYVTSGYAGLQWAANNGADVISMSWGGPGFSQTNQNLINTIHGMDVVMLASAGNDNVTTPQYPAAYNYVINVASTNEDDVKTDFSNYAVSVDVCAPGGYGNQGPSGLLSTTWDLTDFGYYDVYAGTSMSCPLTAGLCGLILSVNPDLTPDQLETVLKSTCEDIYSVPGNENYAGKLGAGRIDAYAAIAGTPFHPVADFYTPVPYITPGTGIQFFDLSAGVPDVWSWEFTGGTPHLSSQQNPTVYFATEGVYTVNLDVTNDFGTDVETKTNYMTVTSTPIPWVLFSANTNIACNRDTIVFTDETLYDPTVWTWDFQPSSVTFVDGTSLTSQNPHVRFEAPGYYTVNLTASNANGTNFKTITDMIFIEGILLNFSEDFESGESNNFNLRSNSRAKVKVDSRAAAPGSINGLHYQGSGLTSGWSGGPTNTTPEQAWNTNVNFHGFAENCNVDATGMERVELTLDLRQTYSVGNKYSWFRVLVNGEQVADIYGNTNFNPATNTDPFDMKIFDLSQFGNSLFDISLQSSCFLSDKFYAEGDNVFVDNIMISNTTGIKEGANNNAGVLTYPNPVTGVLNYSARGTGEQVTVKVLNIQGQTIWQESFKGYKDGDVNQINTDNLSSGVYILQLNGDKGTTTKKFVIE
ncbi:MAG: S8 family serine peptidase [Bacteroidales bacterium]|nr:S8 family serine peptidase [Bacteroidales bacterium]